MSYTTNNVSASQALQNAITSIQGITNGNGSSGGYSTAIGYPTTSIPYKPAPTFKMEMFKSENGGFVMHLITWDANVFMDKTKIFILNDLENMGRDIQNILVMEILKT